MVCLRFKTYTCSSNLFRYTGGTEGLLPYLGSYNLENQAETLYDRLELLHSLCEDSEVLI